MPTLDELDALCAYIEDQQLYSDCLYRPPSRRLTPKAQRPGKVIWLIKEGKPVDWTKKEEGR